MYMLFIPLLDPGTEAWPAAAFAPWMRMGMNPSAPQRNYSPDWIAEPIDHPD